MDISLVSPDRATPNTTLRVPQSVSIEVDPTGEEAEFSAVPLKLFMELVDRSSEEPRLRVKSSKRIVRVGDWRYEVTSLLLDTTATTPRTYIAPSTLSAIRLPGLLQRALRPWWPSWTTKAATPSAATIPMTGRSWPT